MAKSGAAFSLPIPLDAFKTINECMERVYGTGDMRMSMQGDQFQVMEPEEGWGPRKRGRGALPSASNDEMRLRYLALREDSVELTVEDTQYTVLLVSEIARKWFDTVGEARVAELEQIVSALEREIEELAQGGDG